MVGHVVAFIGRSRGLLQGGIAMLADFTRALGRVASHIISAVVGGITGTIGLIADLSGKQIVFPTWVWWLIALGATLITAVRIQMELDRKNRKLLPNVALKELVEWIVGDLGQEGAYTKIGRTLIDIRQQMLLGQLSTWGRVSPHEPLEPIPLEHWQVAQFEYLDYLRDPKSPTKAARHPGPTEKYWDVHFDATEAREVFPSGAKKLRLRLPFERKYAPEQ